MTFKIIRYKPVSELPACLIAEFIGTFFLIMAISMGIQQTIAVGPLVPIGIGFMLCANIFAFGYISGALFNPAVTVALVLIRLTEVKKAVLYIVAQLLGGFCGALLSWYLVGVNADFKAPGPQTHEASAVGRSAVAEFIFTFGLINIIYNVACSRQRDNQHYGLAIGVYLISAVFSVGGISGGSFNPAVATSLQIVNCMANSCQDVKYLWVYWLSPIAAAFVSAHVFALMHPVNVDEEAVEDAEQQALLDKHKGVSDLTPRASAQAAPFGGETRNTYGIQAPNRNQSYFGGSGRNHSKRETEESLNTTFGIAHAVDGGDGSTQAYMGAGKN